VRKTITQLKNKRQPSRRWRIAILPLFYTTSCFIIYFVIFCLEYALIGRHPIKKRVEEFLKKKYVSFSHWRKKNIYIYAINNYAKKSTVNLTWLIVGLQILKRNTVLFVFAIFVRLLYFSSRLVSAVMEYFIACFLIFFLFSLNYSFLLFINILTSRGFPDGFVRHRKKFAGVVSWLLKKILEIDIYNYISLCSKLN